MNKKNWKELIRPRGLTLDSETLTDTYGKFEAKPLERGYGTTLGNSIRRVLLSSLQGAAITHVKIEGVLHEFSTIKDVAEDVTDIILNLKEVRFRVTDADSAIAHIDISGEKEVKASDISCDQNTEVLNPDHLLATVYKGGKLKMELSIKTGKGYVPAEMNKEKGAPIGLIPIDSVYSPIRKVNFNVTNARVGQMTNFDKLTLEIWSDGSIRPDDAVAYAAKILKEQLTVFINFEEAPEEEEIKAPIEDEKDKITDSLNRRVDELELSVRSANCLQNANIKFIGELVLKTESEMLKTKNFGRKSLNEIKQILTDMGLTLGMNVSNWIPPKDVASKKEKEEEF